MTLKLIVRRLAEFKTRLTDDFSAAESYKLSSADLDARINRTLSGPQYDKLPRWAQSELYGYKDALNKLHYRHVENVFRLNGELTRTVPDGSWHLASFAGFYYKGSDRLYH